MTRYAKYFPVIATAMIEAGALGQLYRMWTVKSSLGQNPWSWVMLITALVLWERYYAICTPDQKAARYTAWGSILIDTLVLLTVVHYS